MNNGYFIKTKDNLSRLVTKYVVDDESEGHGDTAKAIEEFIDHKRYSHVLKELGLDNHNSVLENMHLRVAFHLIENDGDSLLDGVPEEKLEYVKQVIADGVL